MIRWLFFILLLINLLLLLWAGQQTVPDPGRLPPLPNDVPGISLVSERDSRASDSPVQENEDATDHPVADGAGVADEEPETAAAAKIEESPKAQAECVRLGPFNHQADAAQLLWELSEKGMEAKVQAETERRSSGYWVLIPPREEAASALMNRLVAAGIQDVWRFSKGELADALSLGLYSDRRQAESRVAELSAKGFIAEIRPRQVEEAILWVQLKYVPEYHDAKSILDRIYDMHPMLRFPPPVCDIVANAQAAP